MSTDKCTDKNREKKSFFSQSSFNNANRRSHVAHLLMGVHVAGGGGWGNPCIWISFYYFPFFKFLSSILLTASVSLSKRRFVPINSCWMLIGWNAEAIFPCWNGRGLWRCLCHLDCSPTAGGWARARNSSKQRLEINFNSVNVSTFQLPHFIKGWVDKKRARGKSHILYLLIKTSRCHPNVTASVGRQTTGKEAAIVDSNYKPISN